MEKNTTKQTKKYHKMVSKRRGLAVKSFFIPVSIGVIQKTSLQTFMRKGLKALSKLRNSTKMIPKITQNDSGEVFKLCSFFESVIVQLIPKTFVKRLNCFQEIGEHNKTKSKNT